MSGRSINDNAKAENQRKCGPNRKLRFKGAIAKDDIDTFSGKDVLYLDLLFSEGFRFRIFSPRESAAKRTQLHHCLGSLCEALGKRFEDIPGCHLWEDFAQVFVEFVDSGKDAEVFVKITLNSKGYPTYGSGRCFSGESNMKYSDEDWMYLDDVDVRPQELPQGYKVNPQLDAFDDTIPF